MPATKNQILRIEFLDKLLLDRKWTGPELLNRLNEQIETHGDIIDKRTLYRDINYLIEEKDAPIHRPERGDNYYYYTENFSLKNIPLDEDDVAALKSAVSILKQVDNFSILEEVEPIISKLENRIHSGSIQSKQVVL